LEGCDILTAHRFKNYGLIDVVFLDGGHATQLAQYIHQISPRTIVTRGEMVPPEQKLPPFSIPGPWETCFTLGNQWQYKPTNRFQSLESRRRSGRPVFQGLECLFPSFGTFGFSVDRHQDSFLLEAAKILIFCKLSCLGTVWVGTGCLL
jgi:hypothetical protein